MSKLPINEASAPFECEDMVLTDDEDVPIHPFQSMNIVPDPIVSMPGVTDKVFNQQKQILDQIERDRKLSSHEIKEDCPQPDTNKSKKKVCVHVVHPVTLEFLDRRYFEEDLSKVEDVAILHTMVSTVYPEMGMNFILYDGNAGDVTVLDKKKTLMIRTQQSLITIQKEQGLLSVSNLILLPTLLSVLAGVDLKFKMSDVRCNDEMVDEKQVPVHQPFQGESYFKWQYLDDSSNWQDINKALSIELESFYNQSYTSSKSLPWAQFTHPSRSVVKRVRTNNGVSYDVNMDTMMQTNVSTGHQRAVQRVQVLPWSQQVTGHRWQFKGDNNDWADYDVSTSKKIEKCYLKNRYHSGFNFHVSGKQYTLNFNTMKQMNCSTRYTREVQRIPFFQSFPTQRSNANANWMPMKWEWQGDFGWNPFDAVTSNNIERAFQNCWSKYSFQSPTNNLWYEIHFEFSNGGSGTQFNSQTGNQRNVRRIPSKPKCLDVPNAPNSDVWKGPIDTKRKTFGTNLMSLYMVCGADEMKEIKQCGRVTRPRTGSFGPGLYFYESSTLCQRLGKSRSQEQRGYLIKCVVLTGKENKVSSVNDAIFSFVTSQHQGFDSVFFHDVYQNANIHVVYNLDQVCIKDIIKY